jgi:pantothenate kinase
MDGYHLSRAQLSAMPDPDTAHARRGAAFTFDASSFHSLMQSLRQPLTPSSKTIHAPSFSHATKDPVADDIPVPATCRIIVTEGNYIALDEGEWKKAREYMDEVWFVEVEERVARARLVKRHIAAGLASNEEEAGKRADENDLVNGREIVEKRGRVDEIVYSREDDEWKPKRQGR